ncbi:MAG: polysaccharide deacetylase family protein [Nannocystaceae bacterium]
MSIVSAACLAACSEGSSSGPGALSQGHAASDDLSPSQDPPGGLDPADVPMFVSIGCDDNMESEGVEWLTSFAQQRNPAGSGQTATYDGAALSFTFYHTSKYVGLAGESWLAAYAAGHEVGNHTESHSTSSETTADDWRWEMQECDSEISKLGIPDDEIQGFRTPFLGTNDEVLTVVQEMGYRYDCSLEEGFQTDHDGTNFLWPYTLDTGSPGNDLLVEWGTKSTIGSHPGLWEMPVYALIVPPDDRCAEYGIEPGFRARLQAVQSYFDVEGGKITGFDYNLIDPSVFAMSGEEFAAVLKHSFDLRLEGNRAPFMLGAHATNYVADKEEYRDALTSFIDHVLDHPDVRVVSISRILDWLKDPVAVSR